MKKINLGVIVTTLIIVTISCSLAFFAARIVGNPKDINLVAKNVSITFTDTSNIATNETISPGWNNVKTFTITNNSKEDFNYNILLKGLVNTFESINTLQYKITSDTGYNMDNYLNVIKTETSKDVVLAYDVVIPKGSKQTYQVEFKYISIEEDQSSDMGKKLGGTLAIEASTGKPKIYDKLLADNPTIKTRTDFSTTLTETNVNTLYKTTEDNTDVYYFAGDAKNNWVKFGTWQEDKTIVVGYPPDGEDSYFPKEFNTMLDCTSDSAYTNCEEIPLAKKGDSMYWRIIRTNKDGSIRMLYSGTSAESQTGFIGMSALNDNKTLDPLYVGYMYGTSGSLENNRTNENSSTIKNYIDNWYSKNLVNYTKYLSTTAIYCNDRTLSVSYPNYVIGEWMGFAASDRLTKTNKSPSYNCIATEDKFTVSNTTGNGKLTYPVALMTADEISYAGGVWYTKGKYPFYWAYTNALNKGIVNSLIWQTLTPIHGDPYNLTGGGSEMAVGTEGRLGNPGRVDQTAVRPVISLKGSVVYKSGDGSAYSPYEVVAEPINTYIVSLSVNNGSGTGTVLVEEGKDATFTVTPSDGYKAELETDTCGGTLSGNTYTISNIISAKSCSITFKKNGTSLATLIQTNAVNENGYRYEGSDPNNYIYMENNGTKELWRIIGLFPDGENGENVIRVRKYYERNNYPTSLYNLGTSLNYYPTSTISRNTLINYSLTNFKNTVNYKMYLGTSYSYKSYTSADLYKMERVLESKGTIGPSSSSTATYIGSVGLTYPSDYGYAVLASDCVRTNMPSKYSNVYACYNNNWLYQGSQQLQWLINPHPADTSYVFYVDGPGYLGNAGAGASVTNANAYSPVMALKSDITVTGSGTQSDPYVMN